MTDPGTNSRRRWPPRGALTPGSSAEKGRRIAALKALLREMPEDMTFDMNTGYRADACGTAACLGGFAVMQARNEGLLETSDAELSLIADWTLMVAAAEYLGLDPEVGCDLFYPADGDLRLYSQPELAIAALDLAAEGKTEPWSRVLERAGP